MSQAGNVGGNLDQRHMSIGTLNVHPTVTVDAAAIDELQARVRSAIREELATSEARRLIASEEPAQRALPAPDPSPLSIGIVPPNELGIVVAPDFAGARAHLRFGVRNDGPAASMLIEEVTLTLNGCLLHPKLFYSEKGSTRVPSDTRQIPISLSSGASATLRIEFENSRAAIIYNEGLDAVLRLRAASAVVELGFGGDTSAVPQAMDAARAWAEGHNEAVVLNIPIQPITPAAGGRK